MHQILVVKNPLMCCPAERGRSRLEQELEQANARRPAPSRGECIYGKGLGKSKRARGAHRPPRENKNDTSDVHLPQPRKQSSYYLLHFIMQNFILFLGVRKKTLSYLRHFFFTAPLDVEPHVVLYMPLAAHGAVFSPQH
jgi:hypothetical protein